MVILLSSAFLLSGCTKQGDDFDASRIKIVGKGDQVEEISDNNNAEENPTQEDMGYLSNPDEYSKEKQTVGEATENLVEVVSVEEDSQSGFHSFSFAVRSVSEEKVLPLVVAEPVLDKGVLRITFGGVQKDITDIPYHQSKQINKGAIMSIFHAVTSKEKTSIYEIGTAGNNPFKLESQETEDGDWLISLKVAYDQTYSAPNMDLGSAQFGNEEQKIVGMTSKDSVRITSYSYSATGNILQFIFTTASGTSNPIPSVSAAYDDQNILVVSFDSLSSDKVSTWAKQIKLPAGIVVDITRSGENSQYKFGGLGAKRDFKLSASKSPNQVVVEIKIK